MQKKQNLTLINIQEIGNASELTLGLKVGHQLEIKTPMITFWK